MSEDPARFAAGINFYRYVGNNPTSYSDPFGLSGWLTIYSSGTGDLISGHSWISFTPEGGTMTTYGTWGNNPKGLGNGLHTNLELGRPADATREVYLSDAQEAQLMALIEQYKSNGENGWKLGTPCSTFAADAWHSATGETLNTHWGPISNPSTLKESIVDANGGNPNATIHTKDPGSSSWSNSYGHNSSSNSSYSSSSFGSLLNSFGSLLK